MRELNICNNLLYEIQNEPWADRAVTAGVLNPFLRPPARDRWPNTVDLADSESLAWQARVAAWIADEESRLPAKHLIAQNVTNFRHAVRDLVPGATIANFHYTFPEAALWNRHLARPVACDETGFLDPEDMHYRRQAWRFLLSGGGAYNHLDYSFSAGREDGAGEVGRSPGGGGAALRRQLRALREFLTALPFPEMQPDATTLTRTPGLEPIAFSLPGQAYAFFFTGDPPPEIQLRLPRGRYRAEWLDSVSGRLYPAIPVTATTSDTNLQVPRLPGEGALRLVRVR